MGQPPGSWGVATVKHLRGTDKPNSRFTSCGRFTSADAVVDSYDGISMGERCCDCSPVEDWGRIRAARGSRRSWGRTKEEIIEMIKRKHHAAQTR